MIINDTTSNNNQNDVYTFLTTVAPITKQMYKYIIIEQDDNPSSIPCFINETLFFSFPQPRITMPKEQQIAFFGCIVSEGKLTEKQKIHVTAHRDLFTYTQLYEWSYKALNTARVTGNKYVQLGHTDGLIDKIMYGQLVYTIDMLDLAIHALPFELDKGGKTISCNRLQNLINNVQVINKINMKYFGPSPAENPMMVYGTIQRLEKKLNKARTEQKKKSPA